MGRKTGGGRSRVWAVGEAANNARAAV